MRVRFTQSAERDLERIGDRLAQSDPERARLTVRGVRAAARSLSAMPYVSSPILSSPGVRKKSVRPFVLLYTIRGGEALILRVAHESSDWVSLV